VVAGTLQHFSGSKVYFVNLRNPRKHLFEDASRRKRVADYRVAFDKITHQLSAVRSQHLDVGWDARAVAPSHRLRDVEAPVDAPCQLLLGQ
jgi:hypothetical protein